ncbi:MAG: hypothetical protein JO266_19330 [Acidobacteria bacterium]|nr:hypothetical protein [Acidobacteriota bacterium]MBV8894091.1 hypothetical protein [Acidobacteriota bacterium]MBV9479804.1 hypothetical protein [Acidobacteriota bacterium]
MKQSEVLRIVGDVHFDSPEADKASQDSALETETRTSGLEIWRAILTASRQVPESLQHYFVVQVLARILDDHEVSIGSLHKALRQAFDGVKRVEDARLDQRRAA